jgi:hypothetical protein
MNKFFAAILAVLSFAILPAAQAALASQAPTTEEEQQTALAYQCYGITKVLARTKSQKLEDAGLGKIAWQRFKPVNQFWMLIVRNRTGQSPAAINAETAGLSEQVTRGIDALPMMPPEQAANFREQVESMAALCRDIQRKAQPPQPRGPVLSSAEKSAAQLCVVSALKEIETIKSDIAENSIMSQLTGKKVLEQQIAAYEAQAEGFATLLKLQSPAINPPYRNAEASLALEDSLTDQSIEQAMRISEIENKEAQAAIREGRPRNLNVADEARQQYESLLAEVAQMRNQRDAGCNALAQKFSGGPQQ